MYFVCVYPGCKTLLPKVVACEGPLIMMTGSLSLKKKGCSLIRACSLIRSNTLFINYPDKTIIDNQVIALRLNYVHVSKHVNRVKSNNPIYCPFRKTC